MKMGGGAPTMLIVVSEVLGGNMEAAWMAGVESVYCE